MGNSPGIQPNPPKRTFVNFLQDYLTIKYAERSFGEYLYVSVKKQKLFHIRDMQIISEYVISTARNGVGSESNSEKTPSGLHSIFRKIGDGVPMTGVFVNRSYSGSTAGISTRKLSSETDDVTTRIMWLAGEEDGVNKGGNIDSKSRNIYIHGTPEEGLLGTPASHGCIRMGNADVISLYNAVREGTYVIILNN
ncbi:MAG: L,D-transpeptidase [Gammaproteobacteria bacterium]